MSRRGFGYVMLLTLIVTLAGSAGIFALENDKSGGGLTDYESALLWTAMVMTTMGSESGPAPRKASPRGRRRRAPKGR